MRLPLTVTLPALAGLFLALPAQASLISPGVTAQAFFSGPDLGIVSEPEITPPVVISLDSTNPTTLGCGSTCLVYNSPAPGDVTIEPQGLDDSKIVFTANTVAIVNEDTAAFCVSGEAPCPGESWYFEFEFSGVNISGVSVDASTPTDFLPTGTGLKLLSPTEFILQVGSDQPKVGDTLTLDVQTGGSAPVPEPGNLLLLGGGLALVAVAGYRRIRGARGASFFRRSISVACE
jgi:hypothetical protein